MRGAQSMLLAAALLPSTIGPAAPALADQATVYDHRDPDVRVLVEIKSLTVRDDMDWGEGEMRLATRVRANGRLLVGDLSPEYHASSGDIVQVNRWIPRSGNDFGDPQVSPELGIPLRFSDTNVLTINATEIDPVTDDNMGTATVNLLDANGQVRFGTHVEEGVGGCPDDPIGVPFCPPGPGAFTVEYVIREALLPDLRPVGIKVLDLPGSPFKLVCSAIQNTGARNAGPFDLTMRVDYDPSKDRQTQAGGMASGQAGDLCVEMSLPPGQHRLMALVDPGRSVAEVRETNNAYEESILARIIADADDPAVPPQAGTIDTGNTNVPVVQATPTAPQGPTSRPATGGTGKSDLTVAAVKVNGQVPDGKGDCKTGENAVVVVVKNGGTTDAEAFVVRLTPGTDQGAAVERTVNGLKAGQEQEVSFGELGFKAGEQKLTATVDARGVIAEANEENNGRTVTAACQSAA
jgi:hypothetical protein